MSLQVFAFNRIHDEACSMLSELNNYISSTKSSGDLLGGGADDVYCCGELLRITSRLTQVMAWAMLHRAIHHGEITAEEACLGHNRLSGHAICLDDTSMKGRVLPSGLKSLLDRSYLLYVRTSRLERMILHRVKG